MFGGKLFISLCKGNSDSKSILTNILEPLVSFSDFGVPIEEGSPWVRVTEISLCACADVPNENRATRCRRVARAPAAESFRP